MGLSEEVAPGGKVVGRWQVMGERKDGLDPTVGPRKPQVQFLAVPQTFCVTLDKSSNPRPGEGKGP